LSDEDYKKLYGRKRRGSTYKIDKKGFGYSIENWWEE
jgi:hypothetical protein